ncbi:nascent polypeptide-associated complex protein [archaeon]|jgi:nascent polypeptide-associated complex subunit alpha|nr:nascent polypeptide-associated complex protein [archaeon]
MMPGLNPKKMQAVMKQMGMSQEEIDAFKVTIERNDGTSIIFHNPSVTKITMQGQDNYQISGETEESSGAVTISEEDINTVVEKTGCTEEQAEKVLENVNGDLAEAILELSE